MNANLVGAAGDWFGFDEVQPAVADGDFAIVTEERFGILAMSAAGVAFSGANDPTLNVELLFLRMLGGEKDVALVNFAVGELLGERVVRDFGFCKDEQAGGGFIEAVDDGEVCPAWIAMAEPFVDPFARIRGRGMCVKAGRFVNHQQMLVLMNDAGQSL